MPRTRRQLGRLVAGLALFATAKAQAGVLSGLAGAAKLGSAAKAGTAAKVAAGAAGVMAAEELAVGAALAARAAEAARATQKLRKALTEFDQGGVKAQTLDELRPSARKVADQGVAPYTLPAGRLALLHSVRKLLGKLPKVVYANSQAKAFSQSFLRGARDSKNRLRQLRAQRAALVDSWLQSAPEKRVFIIGASQDSREIRLLQRNLQRDGFATYFYKNCEAALAALCTSEEVGAFFATAAHAVLVQSPSVALSGFIPVELATAHSLSSGGMVLVFTPDDLMRAASRTAGSAQVVAATAGTQQSGAAPVQAEQFAYTPADLRA